MHGSQRSEFRLKPAGSDKVGQFQRNQPWIKLRVERARVDPRPPFDQALARPREIGRAARIGPGGLEQRIFHPCVVRRQRTPLALAGKKIKIIHEWRLRHQVVFVQAVHRRFFSPHPAGRPAKPGFGLHHAVANHGDDAVFKDARGMAALEIDEKKRLLDPTHARVFAREGRKGHEANSPDGEAGGNWYLVVGI